MNSEPYYEEHAQHLSVRSGEHVGISSLTYKRVQPRKKCCLPTFTEVKCNYWPSSEYFSALYHKNKMYLLELKESLLIMGDRPSMNQNICSTSLFLLGWGLITLFTAVCGFLWSVFSYFM